MKRILAVVTSCVVFIPLLAGAQGQGAQSPKFSFEELSRNQSDWPAEVKLKERVVFPLFVSGQEAGESEVLPGEKVRLLEVRANGELAVSHNNVTKIIPASITDIEEQVRAKRLDETVALRVKIADLEKQVATLKAENDRLRRLLNLPSSSASSGRPSAQSAPAQQEKTYWLNTLTNERHNSSCPRYKKGLLGRECGPTEGRPCPQCGG